VTDLFEWSDTPAFVSVQRGSFQLGGRYVFLYIALLCLLAEVPSSPFRFYGTNAYWLQMTTDADMDLTFHDIATAGFNVVRTWAFNDVARKPSSGPYFQVFQVDRHVFPSITQLI
jgi:mannan endo-1,4-beta-mannosidase